MAWKQSLTLPMQVSNGQFKDLLVYLCSVDQQTYHHLPSLLSTILSLLLLLAIVVVWSSCTFGRKCLLESQPDEIGMKIKDLHRSDDEQDFLFFFSHGFDLKKNWLSQDGNWFDICYIYLGEIWNDLQFCINWSVLLSDSSRMHSCYRKQFVLSTVLSLSFKGEKKKRKVES